MSATTVVKVGSEAIFAVLADPAKQAATDGTGWVRELLDAKPLGAVGQILRMSMNHGTYQVANRVRVFDRPNPISWEPGNEAGDGTLSFPGWLWRYDLTPTGPSKTTVTLTSHWSGVRDPVRNHIGSVGVSD